MVGFAGIPHVMWATPPEETMAPRAMKRTVLGLVLLAAWAWHPASAQQFNSDNYLSKPAGMATIILTAGQRTEMFMATFSLIPRWEFTTAAYIQNSDNDPATDDGYSTTFYFKWMLFENAAKTGGMAFKGGTGLDPGYLNDVGVQDAFKTYWVNTPITLPFFKNKVSLDLMPGASLTKDYGEDSHPAWAFTYSTRLAWYPTSPTLALVGEVYGGAGEVVTKPKYKTGLRLEPNQYTTFALTYGQGFDGSGGSGFEVGMMLFTPPFFCISGCKVPK
jgi:hypothetical protein